MVFRRIKQTRTYQRVATWTKRYERFWMPLMLIGGFFGDVIQYGALNIWLNFIIMGVYVIVSTGALLIIHYPYASQTRGLRALSLAAPFVHQFAIGGLLSTSLLFYWFSGASSVSWPLLAVVALFMLGNEFVREHFSRPFVQVGVLSFSLFSLAAILFSFVFNSLDASIFLLGGAVSLGFMLVFASVLIRVGQFERSSKAIFLTIASVYALMTAGYFGNIIPPIPLSIREAGIYHNLIPTGGDYQLTGEEESWIDRIIPGQTIHANSTDALYAYTSIFAPTNLTTTIVHKWQSYDADAHTWSTQSTLSFPIVGGRDEGYRGYSRKSHLSPGTWRVSVETPRGQVLGRINFTVVTP